MKHKPFRLLLFIVVALSVSLIYGQALQGPGVKKARTLEDYKPSTLQKIAARDPKRDGLLPFRVRVIFEGSARPISKNSNDALHHWAQCCAGSPDHYTKNYLNEVQFVENGKVYWLPVHDSLVADLQRELKAGEAVNVFLIRVSARRINQPGSSVLLVERFKKVEPKSAQLNASLDWIRRSLPSHTGKALKVEIPGPCQLKITDSVNSASVSKAVVFMPLTDLDISKVSVEPHQGGHALWLHTMPGKSSIRFMLYQGSPAEGGQANKYSLSFRDREKAEAMAEAFRRAMKFCAAAKP